MCIAAVFTLVSALGVGDVVISPVTDEPVMVLTVVKTPSQHRLLFSDGLRISAGRGSLYGVALAGRVDLDGDAVGEMGCRVP